MTDYYICGMMSDLVICMVCSMVLHDTECPYWDQVIKQQQAQTQPLPSDPKLQQLNCFWMRCNRLHLLQYSIIQYNTTPCSEMQYNAVNIPSCHHSIHHSIHHQLRNTIPPGHDLFALSARSRSLRSLSIEVIVKVIHSWEFRQSRSYIYGLCE